MSSDQETDSEKVIHVVRQFNQALNRRDLETMMALVTDDCRYENTYPPPDGSIHTSRAQMRAFWSDFFNGAAKTRIEEEEIFAYADRCVMRWVYQWEDPAHGPGHVRGVDVYRVRDGLIAEKLSYVKG